MSEFFGKAGMPWHGAMVVRQARPWEREKVGEGGFFVKYFDQLMNDKKEDGKCSKKKIAKKCAKTCGKCTDNK